jgi:hypothetical protein
MATTHRNKFRVGDMVKIISLKNDMGMKSSLREGITGRIQYINTHPYDELPIEVVWNIPDRQPIWWVSYDSIELALDYVPENPVIAKIKQMRAKRKELGYVF